MRQYFKCDAKMFMVLHSTYTIATHVNSCAICKTTTHNVIVHLNNHVMHLAKV